MAFKFDSLLSESDRARILKTQAEMVRLFNLPNQFLGRALITLARDLREKDPDRFGKPEDTYESRLLWTIMPGIAAQLGETKLNADEKLMARDLPLDPQEMRTYVGHCMNNSRIWKDADDLKDQSMHDICSEAVNGNPITIALDRIAPPNENSQDWPAKYTREISRARFGDDRFSAWEPAMQDYERTIDPFSPDEGVDLVDDEDLEPS